MLVDVSETYSSCTTDRPLSVVIIKLQLRAKMHNHHQ